jgi:hypothetical protein
MLFYIFCLVCVCARVDAWVVEFFFLLSLNPNIYERSNPPAFSFRSSSAGELWRLPADDERTMPPHTLLRPLLSISTSYNIVKKNAEEKIEYDSCNDNSNSNSGCGGSRNARGFTENWRLVEFTCVGPDWTTPNGCRVFSSSPFSPLILFIYFVIF